MRAEGITPRHRKLPTIFGDSGHLEDDPQHHEGAEGEVRLFEHWARYTFVSKCCGYPAFPDRTIEVRSCATITA